MAVGNARGPVGARHAGVEGAARGGHGTENSGLLFMSKCANHDVAVGGAGGEWAQVWGVV